MNDNRDREFDENSPPARRITLRKLVIILLSAAAAAVVWDRTGGDFLLTVVTAPIVFGALDHWIWDDSSDLGPAQA